MLKAIAAAGYTALLIGGGAALFAVQCLVHLAQERQQREALRRWERDCDRKCVEMRDGRTVRK